MAVKARVPVEIYFDEDLGTWHFHVEEPRISGGGQTTADEARLAAAQAIAFALEGSGKHSRPSRIEYVEVAVGL